jgi:Fe-coproporphyrin III synthase
MKREDLMYPENRIALWLGGQKTGPLSLEIKPTNRCNLNCIHCGAYIDFDKRQLKKSEIDKHNKKKELSTRRYIELIEEASKLGVVSICISGGEPLVRKDTSDIISKIKEKNIQGELNTNGTLLTKDISDELVQSSWDRIVISLDGPNKNINDYLRNYGFDEIVKNVKYLISSKKRYKSKKPKITIATVLTNKNYNVINKMLKLCKKLHVDNFRLQELLNRSEKCKDLELNEKEREEFKKSLPRLLKYSKRLKLNTNLGNFDLIEKGKKFFVDYYCFSPFYELPISSNGNVRPCIISPNIIGNIKNKSLKEIWFGKKMETFRERLLNKDFPDYCKNCCSPRVFDMKSINEKIKKRKIKTK